MEFQMQIFAIFSVTSIVLLSASAIAQQRSGTPVAPHLQSSTSVASPNNIEGKVEGGVGPIADASVTLWAAGPGAPQKIAETQTKSDGSFELESAGGKD